MQNEKESLVFEWEPSKINLKDLPWALIVGLAFIIFFIVGIATADPTTALEEFLDG